MKRIPVDCSLVPEPGLVQALLGSASPVKTDTPGGPIVRFTFSDNPGPSEIRNIFLLFDDLIKKAVKAGYFPEFYIILDFTEFSSTGRITKDLVKTKLEDYYNAGNINSVAVISPNYLIQTVGRVLTGVAKNIRISFHHTENDAFNLINFNIAEEDKFEIKERKKYDQTTYEPDWDERGYITFQGWKLPIHTQPHWHTYGKLPGARILRYVINNNIVFVKLEGPLDDEDIVSSLSTYEDICGAPAKQFLGVIDFSEIGSMTKSIQKALEKSNEYLDPFFKYTYVILPWYGKAIYESYKLFSPATVEKVHSMKNIHEAIKEALLFDVSKKPESNSVQVEILSDKFLTNLSQEELIEIIAGLKREMAQTQEKTAAYATELFQILARISWDSNFERMKLSEPDDPNFAKLYQAAQVLQDDMHEIYKTLAEYEAQQTPGQQ